MGDNKYSVPEKVQIIKWIYSGSSQINIMNDLFPAAFPLSPVPNQSTISRLVARFEETGSVLARKRPGRPKTATSEIVSTNVLAAVEVLPHTTSRELAMEIGISSTSVLRILKQAKYHPYKMQFHQELVDGDQDRRVQYCQWAKDMCDRHYLFLRSVCMSDESKFYLHGEVNTQNCRYWARENPHWMADTRTQYPQSLNVWAGILDNRIIGPFFLPERLSGEGYLDLLINNVGPAVEEIAGGRQVWFQQDGAPPHYALIVRDHLDNAFPARWIGRRGAQEWPPRSPDLTIMDFFYWGYLKSKVYTTKPANLDELRDRIITASAGITREQLQNVSREMYHRLGHCLATNGEHFENLL